jgi:PAS domain S-box-containing protein
MGASWPEERDPGDVGPERSAGRLALTVGVDRTGRLDPERCQALLEVLPEALVLSAADGTVLAANESAFRLTGYAPEDLLGRQVSLISPPEERAAAADEHQQTFAGPEPPAGYERVVRRADGTDLPVEVRRAFLIEDGRRVGLLSSLRDISARRSAEHARQRFLAMVTHELGNPLAAVRGYAQLMRRRGAYDEQSIDTIVAKTGLLERLIRDLLETTRVDLGRMSLQRSWVDLDAQAREAVEQVDDHGAEHRFRFESDAAPVLVWGDRDRLAQVFANLLDNAVKYSPRGGEIVVRIEASPSEARVSVSDQGVGIEPATLARLFDEYFRAGEQQSQAEGLGLGLYITRGIVEAHGGRISATSTVGLGSTFRFSLPRGPGDGG